MHQFVAAASHCICQQNTPMLNHKLLAVLYASRYTSQYAFDKIGLPALMQKQTYQLAVVTYPETPAQGWTAAQTIDQECGRCAPPEQPARKAIK